MSKAGKRFVLAFFVVVIAVAGLVILDKSKETQFESVEAAMQNADISIKSADKYQKTITQEIYRFENKEYITIFFRSRKDESEESLTLAKFRISDGSQYQFVVRQSTKVTPDSIGNIDGLDLVKKDISSMDMLKPLNIDSENTTFLCGQNGDAAIMNLKIEGQTPDGIVPFAVFGKQRYFWYYKDFTPNTSVEDMVITMDE